MDNLAKILEFLKKQKGSNNTGIANALPALQLPVKDPRMGGLDEQLPPFNINALAQKTGIKPFNGGFAGQQMQPPQVGGNFLGKAKHYLLDPTYHKTTGNAEIDKLHPASFLDSRLGRGLAVGLPAIAGMALTGSPVGGLAGGVIGNKFVKGRNADYLEALQQVQDTADYASLGGNGLVLKHPTGGFQKEKLAQQVERDKQAQARAEREATNTATANIKKVKAQLQGGGATGYTTDPKTGQKTYNGNVTAGGFDIGNIDPVRLQSGLQFEEKSNIDQQQFQKKSNIDQQQFTAKQKADALKQADLQAYRGQEIGFKGKQLSIAQQHADAHTYSAHNPSASKPETAIGAVAKYNKALKEIDNAITLPALQKRALRDEITAEYNATKDRLKASKQKTPKGGNKIKSKEGKAYMGMLSGTGL